MQSCPRSRRTCGPPWIGATDPCAESSSFDAGPLGVACGESRREDFLGLRIWLTNEATNGSEIVIPEITDYEVRRKLIARDSTASIARLDELHDFPGVYLPIKTEPMRLAADLWAKAKTGGKATADERSIDGDVILAAQVRCYCSDSDDWWVATGNAKHLSRYLGDRARLWQSIPLSRESRDVLRQLDPPT